MPGGRSGAPPAGTPSAATSTVAPVRSGIQVLTAPDDPALVRPAEAILGPADRERAALRRTESGRRRTVLGRALLRLLASELLGVRPSEVTTGQSPGGAPQASGAGARLAVSVAHTAGLVVAAASRAAARVGVDVERLDRRTRPEAIARRHFTTEEAEELSWLPAPRRPAAFLRAWTLKEAWGKAAGIAVPAALARIGFPIADLAAASGLSSVRASHGPAAGQSAADGPAAALFETGWLFWTAEAGAHALGIAALPSAGRVGVRIRSGEADLRCRLPALRT